MDISFGKASYEIHKAVREGRPVEEAVSRLLGIKLRRGDRIKIIVSGEATNERMLNAFREGLNEYLGVPFRLLRRKGKHVVIETVRTDPYYAVLDACYLIDVFGMWSAVVEPVRINP